MDGDAKRKPGADNPFCDSPLRTAEGASRHASKPGASPFYIVGVGASAGGLEALESLFEHMPADAGMAFVVVQHLSPDFKSLMDELLSRRTEIAIHRVENGIEVAPDAIYLIPPKKEMIISGGRLLLTDRDPATGLSLPIDTFFRSLAQELGEQAIGIVLSGTGSDGSRGVRAIHEAGGLVLVQDEHTARFDGMPRSAVETGVVDLILPPGSMAQALLDYIRHPRHGSQTDTPRGKTPSETGMNAVYGLLRAEFGIDFSNYKPNTVLRRIDRRLQLNRSMDLDEYVERLRSSPNELNLLYRDLLIGVTRFFRDAELFDLLKADLIPAILAKSSPEEEVRVWVAGCATGEEAYSLAILFHEAMVESDRTAAIKIFATDVHRASLEFASLGLYDEDALTEMTPARRDRYFTRQAARFQVAQDIRKLIVFAPHNVIKDAPFTKLDLISCRNLLIYLQAPAQKKALSLFHFGLKTGGALVLGPSESPGDISDEFETLDGRWKVYRKRRDVRLPTDKWVPLTPPLPRLHSAGVALRPPTAALPDTNLLQAYDELVGSYVPPSFLITPQRELLHTFAGAGQYLRVPDGRPSVDILDMVDHDLRLAISNGMQRAHKEGKPYAAGAVRPRDGQHHDRLRVVVRPVTLRGAAETHFLVSLEPDAPTKLAAEPVEDLNVEVASERRLFELEDELRYTKENLQATLEEMETTNEELQATNEELVASNEELQSTNEELHSVNEELYTVNAEYQRKIIELTELTDDMDNLLQSTDIGTIFLDRDLLIRKFTPQIAHAFQLLPQDVGRRIDSFAHNILHAALLDDIQRVLVSGQPIEHDVQDKNGEWFLLRILPYRTKIAINGVVVTLIPISRLKATEKDLRRLSKVFMDGADPIIVEDLAGRITDLNREAELAYGWSRDELLGEPVSKLIPDQMRPHSDELREQCRRDDSVRNVESVRRDKSGNEASILLTLSLLYDESGKPVAIASIAKDITRQKQAEQEAREAARRRDQFLAILSHELRNPLGAMLNATRLLQRAGAEDPTLERACSIIERQSKQMARLLDDLLDVSRVTQGKIRITKQVVDLVAIAQEAVQVVQSLIDERGHTLELELPDHPIYVEGDPSRLLQVQENLLENAAKYTPRGGALRLVVREQDHQGFVSVLDNGIGIPPDMQTRIFELFVQSPELSAETEGGMGIGLTLAQSIVSLHNGQIIVRSRGPGLGSEFEVCLPLTDKRPTLTTIDDSPAESNIRVVIIEDNSDSREMLEQLLTMDGYVVTTARDGTQGLQTIASQQPEVALVDLGLPGIDGYEVARRVRSELTNRSIRLIALTGYGRSIDRDAVFAAGFDEHLVKPIDPEDLVRILRKHK